MNGAELKMGETRDLSLNGACMAVSEEFRTGDILRIELRPKTDSEVITGIAHVLRSKRADETEMTAAS